MLLLFSETIVIAGKTLKPIFHWKWGLRWLPNANEIYTKKMKCKWPTPEFFVGTQRHLYSTDWRWGLASGLTQIIGLASGVWRRGFGVGGLASGVWCRVTQKFASANAKYTNMLVYFALGNPKFWRQVHCPTPTPDARYFAFWWNIGLMKEESPC